MTYLTTGKEDEVNTQYLKLEKSYVEAGAGEDAACHTEVAYESWLSLTAPSPPLF